MRLFTLYVGVFLAIGLGLSWVLGTSANPEEVIVGDWQELKWEYEVVDKNPEGLLVPKDSEVIKSAVTRDLLIHMAENWQFMPNGKLKLKNNHTDREVTWRIKGRGDILQIRYDRDTVENYNIAFLDKEKMVLNFESAIHARGIAKLTFDRAIE